MNELIKVTYEKRNTVLGRDLYNFLEIGTDYSNWMKRMIDYGFEEGLDFTVFRHAKNGEPISGTLKRVDHQLTLDMAKEISMLQRNEKGEI
jgi:anti-repressor protein